MSRKIFLLYVLIFQVAVIQAQQKDWTLVNPFIDVSRIRKVEILNDKNLFFHDKGSTVDHNYIDISNDKGDTWRKIQTQTLVDFTMISENVGFLLYSNKLEKSSNQFNTISSSITLPAGNCNGIYFYNASEAYITTGNSKILKSTDGGATWIAYPAPGNGTTLKVHFVNSQKGFAITNGGEILKTSDGGLNWTVADAQSYQYNALAFKDENTGVAVGKNGALRYTTDGGTTWSSNTQYTNTFNDVKVIDGLFHIIGTGSTLLVGSGTEWQKKLIETQQSGGIPFYALGKGRSFHIVATNQDYSKNDKIYSTENLQNWTVFKTAFFGADLQSSFFNDNHAIAVGRYIPYEYSVVYTTDNGGATWTYRKNVGRLFSLKTFKNTGNAFLAYNQTIEKSSDFGTTWTTQAFPLPNTSSAFAGAADFLETGEMFITIIGYPSYNNTSVIKNSGSGWSAPSKICNERVTDIRFLNSLIGFSVTENNTVYRTSDGGTTWTKAVIEGVDVGKITIVNNNLIYIGKFVSYNAGETWQAVSNQMIQFVSYEIHPDKTGYGVLSNYDLYKTIDGGATWVLDFNSQNAEISDAVLSKNSGSNVLLTGSKSSIYKIYTSPTLSLISPKINESIILYPNPVKDFLTFKTKGAVADVEVLDFSGRSILQIPRLDNHQLNLQNLPKGVYLIKGKLNNKAFSERVIKN
ncbi:MAG: T9SS type A sorting domain-containing protein [Bergeyella sp.]